MIIPEKVIKGDRIHVVAPAGRVNKNHVKRSITNLTHLGFEVIEGNSLFEEYGSFAGNDKQRLDDLQKALDDPKAKAIMLARGGYGVLRIIDKLDLASFKNHPKWVIGFSDNTALLNLLHKNGIASIHGAMPNSLPEDLNDIAWESLLRILAGQTNEIMAESSPFNRTGEIAGEIVGGNLTLLSSTLGSNTQIDTQGKILFLEDISEYHYKLDRMMMALGRAGIFDNIIGLVVGQLTEMIDGGYGSSPEAIISEIITRYNPHCPIGFNLPCGHITSNQSIALGFPSQISITDTETTIKQAF